MKRFLKIKLNASLEDDTSFEVYADVQVHYEPSTPHTWSEQGDPEEFEILSVEIGGVDQSSNEKLVEYIYAYYTRELIETCKEVDYAL